jgi:hypothetical protein
LVRQTALELVARAKLWAVQNKESSITVVAELKGKVEDLEVKLGRATEQTLELFNTAKKLASKKLGAEVKLNNFVEARRRAAAILAIRRMQQAGLMEAWGVWAHLGTAARKLTVAEERIIARILHNRLAAAMLSWSAVLRTARLEARAKAFAFVLSSRRIMSVLKWWASATRSAKWTEHVLIARARLAEMRGRAQCQLLMTALRTWDEFTEQQSEQSRASITSANISKFVAC